MVNSPSATHQSSKDFWIMHKETCCLIRSVKQIFELYRTWCLENNKAIQNEYRFRTFIRKNGYKNGQ